MRGSGVRAAALAAALIGGLVCVPSALSAAPGNDQFANAQALSGETGTFSGTNVEATKEPGEPNHAGDPGGASVWFTWTAPRRGVLIVDTCDSDFDTLLAVYTGSAVDGLMAIAANDNACDLRSGLELDVTAGTVYRIAVDGNGGTTGAITIFYGMAPPNDDFASAASITGSSGSASGDTFLASHEDGEPFHAGEPGAGSIWYRWTAPGDGVARFNTCGVLGDTLLAVYTGSDVASLTAVAANDDSCDTRSRVEFNANAGTTYSIAVDGFLASVPVWLNWSWELHRPLSLSPPTISGAAVENGILHGSVGQWGFTSSFHTYWESCVPGNGPGGWSCQPVLTGSGQLTTELTLRVPTSVFGRQLRLRVQAQGPGGIAVEHSALTTAIGVGPPLSTLPPSIVGVFVRVGAALTADEGRWDFGHATQSGRNFVWQRCNPTGEGCRDIGAAGTGRFYTLAAADRGSTMRLVVTMASAGGATSAVSAPTSVVTAPPPAVVRRCRVPRIAGKRLETARRTLVRANCRLGVVRRVWSARRRGVIVRQRPRAGTRLRAGGRVNVVLSKGRRR